MKQKNYAIEFWRFVFCIIIILFHAENSTALEEKYFVFGFYCVEFYFVLSGFLLMQSMQRTEVSGNIIGDVKKFVLQRFQRFAPVYYITLLITFLYRFYVYHICAGFSRVQLKEYMIASIPEWFMVNSIFYNTNHTNGPDWYISALLIVETLMFVMFIYLRKNKKIQTCLLSIICVVALYLYYWNSHLFTAGMLLVRAIGEIALGMLLYLLYLKSEKYMKEKKIVLSVLEVSSVLAICYFLFEKEIICYRFFIIVPFALLIYAVFCNNSIWDYLLNNKISMVLGKLSFPCYLIQIVVLVKYGWFPGFDLVGREVFSYIIIVLVCVVYGAVMLLCMEGIKSLCAKNEVS